MKTTLARDIVISIVRSHNCPSSWSTYHGRIHISLLGTSNPWFSHIAFRFAHYDAPLHQRSRTFYLSILFFCSVLHDVCTWNVLEEQISVAFTNVHTSKPLMIDAFSNQSSENACMNSVLKCYELFSSPCQAQTSRVILIYVLSI